MAEAGYPGYTGPTVTIEDRKATINRAIDWIERTDAETLALVLHSAEISPRLRDNPKALVAALREGISSGRTFGAWKGAQRICRAAGLDY